MKYLIKNGRIVTPKKTISGGILVEGNRIARIGAIRSAAGAEIIDADGLVALPGFIDIHTHGGCGFDATNGMYNPATGAFDASVESFQNGIPLVMRRFAQCGATRALLATFAAPEEELKKALSHVADYVEGAENGINGTRLEGSFVEGTFIRHPERAGAQNPAYFMEPDIAAFESLNAAARGTIRYVNAVTEFGEASVKLAKYLTKKGILAGSGHTDCPADQVLRCLKAGNRISVHFLNGAVGSSFKPFNGGNVVEAVLGAPQMYVEQICDGFHISPRYVLDVVARKGFDRVVLVTDQMFLAGMTQVRKFSIAGKPGVVSPKGDYVQVEGNPQVLYGSVLNMATAFSNLLSWLTAGISGIWQAEHPAMRLEDALIAVSKCASSNAAQLLGLDQRVPDAPSTDGTGAIAAGKCADITLCKLTGTPGRYKLSVKHTFVAGRKVI